MTGFEEEEQEPIVRIPKATGDIQVGDYVFACRWGDADPGDPWAIGHVSEMNDPAEDYGYVVVGDSPARYRRFPHAIKVTPELASRIMAHYPRMEREPTDYEMIASVWQPDKR